MTPQDALRQLVKQDRARSLDDPAWVRAMLSDWCPEPEHRRQVNLLVLACREGVGRDLAGNVGRAIDGFAIARLVSRLVDGHATADEHARWAVGTWALALGVSTAPVTDLRPSDPVRPPVPERVPDPAPVADPGRPALVVDAGAVWGAYATIGEAIRASVVPGTLITVKPGIYREALVIDRVVEIVGEGDRARIVVEATDTDAVTVTAVRAAVRNLTVRAVGSGDTSAAVWVQHGRVVIEGCDLTSAIGAVVFITGKDTAPFINSCAIRDGKDYGIVFDERAQGTITNCVISRNANAGVIIMQRANPVVRNCHIRDGKHSGVYVGLSGQGIIEQCVISGNVLAGVGISEGGNPIVRDCQIRDGQDAGVDVYEQGQGTIERCVISGNANAGVRIETGGNPTVRDCQICDGQASGVWVHDQGQGTFTGNTLAGNARGAWYFQPTAGNVVRTGNTPNR